MTNSKVFVASFYEAFQKFLSYSDDSLSLSTLASFAKLKEEGRISYSNEDRYWHGNHSHCEEWVELVMIVEPIRFYVVRFHYSEMSDNSHSRTETTVFVPNEG